MVTKLFCCWNCKGKVFQHSHDLSFVNGRKRFEESSHPTKIWPLLYSGSCSIYVAGPLNQTGYRDGEPSYWISRQVIRLLLVRTGDRLAYVLYKCQMLAHSWILSRSCCIQARAASLTEKLQMELNIDQSSANIHSDLLIKARSSVESIKIHDCSWHDPHILRGSNSNYFSLPSMKEAWSKTIHSDNS